jgi:hypothetical protein
MNFSKCLEGAGEIHLSMTSLGDDLNRLVETGLLAELVTCVGELVALRWCGSVQFHYENKQ